MALSEELELELEALRATYDELEIQQRADAAGQAAATAAAARFSVALPVAPRCEAEHERFVAARLVLTVGPGYPEQPPGVQLADAKGLGDARLAALQSALAAEAAALAGELSLGHLVETALDLLTEANQPEGLCAFCLEALLLAGQEGGTKVDNSGRGSGSAAEGVTASGALLRLGCYHCYHNACFAPWWQWQQRQLAAREAQLWSEFKSMAPLKLGEEGIRREPAPFSEAAAAASGGAGAVEDGQAVGVDCDEVAGGASDPGSCGREAFVVACPACRAEVPPASLAYAWRELQASSADSWTNGSAPANDAGTGPASALQQLPQQQRRALAAMQQRHEAVRRRQAACGGLVEATHSVSISDLQAAATAAAAAEATAAAAAAQAAAATAGAAAQQRPAERAPCRGGRGGRGERGGRYRSVEAGRHSGGGGRARGRHPAHDPSAGSRGQQQQGPGPAHAAAAERAMADLQLGGHGAERPAHAQRPGRQQQHQASKPPGQQQQQRQPGPDSGSGMQGRGRRGTAGGRGRGRGPSSGLGEAAAPAGGHDGARPPVA